MMRRKGSSASGIRRIAKVLYISNTWKLNFSVQTLLYSFGSWNASRRHSNQIIIDQTRGSLNLRPYSQFIAWTHFLRSYSLQLYTASVDTLRKWFGCSHANLCSKGWYRHWRQYQYQHWKYCTLRFSPGLGRGNRGRRDTLLNPLSKHRWLRSKQHVSRSSSQRMGETGKYTLFS